MAGTTLPSGQTASTPHIENEITQDYFFVTNTAAQCRRRSARSSCSFSHSRYSSGITRHHRPHSDGGRRALSDRPPRRRSIPTATAATRRRFDTTIDDDRPPPPAGSDALPGRRPSSREDPKPPPPTLSRVGDQVSLLPSMLQSPRSHENKMEGLSSHRFAWLICMTREEDEELRVIHASLYASP